MHQSLKCFGILGDKPIEHDQSCITSTSVPSHLASHLLQIDNSKKIIERALDLCKANGYLDWRTFFYI